jgi:hypothetical protein
MEYIETAEEFANYLRFKYNNGYLDGKVYDAKYIEKLKSELKEIGYEGTTELSDIEERIIGGLVEDILPVLNEEQSVFVKENIHFGVINSSTVNATIYKNDYNKFAIMFRIGLITFLNKYFKLLIALENISWITFCDRKEITELTKGDIIEYLDELVENTRLYGKPSGVKIILNSEGRIHQANLLDISELFIMCHEFGHFLNGDLDKKEDYHMIYEEDKQISELSIKHEREYEADHTGFQLMLNILKNRGIDGKLSYVFPVLLNLFQGLQQLSKEEITHPEPFKRLYVLGHSYLGEETANTLAECMYNQDCNSFYKLITNQ